MTREELTNYSKYVDSERLQHIERQRELFEAAKPALMTQYLDKYVAFEDGRVLDSDTDRQRLAERVYKKYGYRDLLMQKVSLEKRVYSVGGFQSAQRSN